MKKSEQTAVRSYRQRCMVAVVVGTALSSFGSPAAPAAAASAAAVPAVSDISRYCTACWRNARLHPDSWTDCTQEVLCRLLERVSPSRWNRLLADDGDERRELIRAIDTVKKRTQRSRRMSSGWLDTLPDQDVPRDQALAEDRAVVRQASAAVLSPRQQRIMQMSMEGWSVHDIASELRASAERVSDEKYKAVHKLRDFLKTA